MQASRRSFLKSSAVAALATNLFPLSLLNNSQQAAEKGMISEEKGLVFLFQGDSITDGNRGRNNDPNHIMGHGYAFSIASRIGADFPELDAVFINRGISGNTVPDLQKRWQSDALDLKPGVLSILIGINDAAAVLGKPNEAPDVQSYENGYRDLLRQSRRANPYILFVLGLPFVFPIGRRKENWERWKEETEKRAAVVRSLAKEFTAVLVDYPAAFENVMKRKAADYWIWDGIHHTVFGHEIMAREWMRQVSTRLKFLKKYK
jgi:lysophospholipase L1-like esterase